jgi:hypothetical protein
MGNRLNGAMEEGFGDVVSSIGKDIGKYYGEISASVKEALRYDRDIAHNIANGFGARFVRREGESESWAVKRQLQHETKLASAHLHHGIYDSNLRVLTTFFILHNCADEVAEYYTQGQVMPSERVRDIRDALEENVVSHLGIRKLTKNDAGIVTFGRTTLSEYELTVEPSDSSHSFLNMYTVNDARKASLFMNDLIKKYKEGINPLPGEKSTVSQPFGMRR